MKIKIDLLSHTLTGSGEGAGIIDSDVIFDDFGFPYIPSRRIKGVLRESAQEVCDILGVNDYKIVNSIFGKDGFTEGKLHMGNFFINDYKEIKEEIENLRNYKNSIYRGFVNSSKIISYYTELRQQTSIEEDSTIAKESSLRTFRVLKPGLKFAGKLYEITPLTKKEKAILYLAAINLKRIGTSRNRGFGEIRCSIEDIEIRSLDDATKYLNSDKNIVEESKFSDLEKFNADKKGNVKKLSYKITTLSPIVLSKEIGEQNTINTEKYIPSTTIRGLFANKFINEFNLGRAAHKNDNFYNLFLKNEIIFTPAYPFKNNEYYPALYLHKEKGKDSNLVYNILEKAPDKKTKPLNKTIHYNDDKVYTYDISTTFYFHNARDRAKGHSIGENIFYYEAINEGEEFKGFIIGDEGYLQGIKNAFKQEFVSFIGRSKSAQYGLVKIELGDLEDTKVLNVEDEEFSIVAVSPIILHNDWGFSEISEKTLKNYLKKYFNDCNIVVDKIIARAEYVENFVGIWGMKNARELAYSPGSAFKIIVKGCSSLKEKLSDLLLRGLGEKTDLGFGRVKMYPDLSEKYNEAKEEDESKNIDPKISISIISAIIEDEIKDELKIKAFEKANNSFRNKHILKSISNNLIGRLEGMLFDTKSLDDWREKLGKLDKKGAGETLKNINLWDDLYKLYTPDKYKTMFYKNLSDAIEKVNVESDKFELSKLYWIDFFRFIRLFKKEMGEKDE